MAKKSKTQPAPPEIMPVSPGTTPLAPIGPDVLAAVVRQIAGQSVGPPAFGGSPYLKFGFEFFKLGSELMNIFGSLAPAAFASETIRRAPKFPGIYVVLRGDTVVYVGRTENLRRRFAEHWNGTSSFAQVFKGKYRPNNYREFLSDNFSLAWKEFDDVPYLYQLEHTVIAVFQPIFNREVASDKGQTRR